MDLDDKLYLLTILESEDGNSSHVHRLLSQFVPTVATRCPCKTGEMNPNFKVHYSFEIVLEG